jgi:hypothetical protein
MKRFLHSGVVIFAGVLGIASATMQADQDVTKIRKKFDLRAAILRKFFRENHSPAENYAGVFVEEADAHGLDWRLLPSLSMIETGGGKHAPGNNLFGWANGKSTFDSFTAAIHHVATFLEIGKPYKGKDLDGKLMTYNKRPEYRSLITGVMRQISPNAQLEARAE